MDEEIKKLLEKNLELNEKIYSMVKGIKSYIVWSRIFGILKLLIIIVPIIIGLIYLPPLLKDLLSQYNNLLGLSESANQINLDNIDLKSLSPNILKLLK